MATVKKFEDLQVWHDARALVRELYRVTKSPTFSKDFALRDQITRAAVSSMSNIAEGFERGTRKEFVQFLSVAKASAGEVRSQLYVMLDQGYIDLPLFESLETSTLALSRRLSAFICYLQKCPFNSRRRGALSQQAA